MTPVPLKPLSPAGNQTSTLPDIIDRFIFLFHHFISECTNESLKLFRYVDNYSVFMSVIIYNFVVILLTLITERETLTQNINKKLISEVST